MTSGIGQGGRNRPEMLFTRLEFAGSLGDLGTLLPLGIAMIVVNGLHAHSVMVMIGLVYILAGSYFRVPISVEPMKVIGAIFIALGLFFGHNALTILNLLPRSILGVLLLFAGAQLALMVADLKEKKDLFVALVMLAVSLALNLGVAFLCGIVLAYALKSKRMHI